VEFFYFCIQKSPIGPLSIYPFVYLIYKFGWNKEWEEFCDVGIHCKCKNSARQSIAFVLYTIENFWVGLGCFELYDDFIIANTKMFELLFGCFNLLLYFVEKKFACVS
jgi:hypothetical protein